MVSDSLDVAGTALLFVERDSLGIPGSPFEVRYRGRHDHGAEFGFVFP